MVIMILGGAGWEEFVNRELYLAEDFARIVIVVIAGANALLGGQAVIVNWDEQLGVSFQTDDGELTQGYVNALSVMMEAQIRAEAGADAGRNVEAITVAGAGEGLTCGGVAWRAAGIAGRAARIAGNAAIIGVYQLHAQYDGIYHLYHSNGEVAAVDGMFV
jgi:hypothetical protein